MKKITAIPGRIIVAFLEVLNSNTEVEEISEIRINFRQRQKDTLFFYPRQIFR